MYVIPALSVALAAMLWAGARRRRGGLHRPPAAPERPYGAGMAIPPNQAKARFRILLEFGTLMAGEAPMAAPRDALHHMIDRLPDAELGAALRFLKFLSQEPAEPPLAASIRRGITEADAGRTIICHSYDEMVEKVLGKE
jgi:hypothetical protein